MANLGNLLVSLGVDAGPFQSGMQKAAQQADKSASLISRATTKMRDFVNRSFANMGDEILGEFGVRGIDQVVQGIKGLATATVGAAGDFEAGMNRFAAVAGGGLAAAGMEVDQFGDLFLEMGQKTQFSAGEAEEAAINLAKGGIGPATIAAGGLEQALGLAAAGELDLATSADIMAKQLGVWVDKSADAATQTAFMASTADLMAQAANASTVGVDDLAMGLANAGGSAKVAGLSFQETVTTMAQLAPGFSSASDAGTSFKAFIAGLIPDTVRQKNAMEQLGLTTETGASRFYDATGAFIGMEKASELLYQQTKDLTQEQRSLAFQTIFGSDAIRAASIIAERGGSAYAQMADDMEAAGTATDQAAKRQKGWNFALEQIRGSVETLSIVLGTALLPKLTDLATNVILPAINGFLDLARAVTESSDPMGVLVARVDKILPGFQVFLDVAGSLGGLISDNLVPAMILMAFHVSALGLIALPGLITSIITATTAWTGYGAAMWLLANGPMVVVTAAAYVLIKVFQGLMISAEEAVEQQNRHNESIQEAIKVQEELAAIQGEQTPAMQDLNDKLDEQIAKHDQLARKIALESQLGADSIPGFRGQQEARRAMLAEMEAGIDATTQALHEQIVAQEAMTWTLENSARLVPPYVTALEGTGTALRVVQDQVGLTADQLDELDKVLTRTAEEIPQAFAEMVNGVTGFYDEIQGVVNEREAAIQGIYEKYGGQLAAERSEAGAKELAAVQASYGEQLNAAVVAHAAELAEQRQHMGQMLLERVNAFASDPSNGIAAEEAAKMRAAIETEYGIVTSKSQETFNSMTQHIDAWAASGGASTAETITNLQLTEASALSLKEAEDKLAGEYMAQFVHDFEAGKISAEELAIKISQIPTLVKSSLEHNYWDAMKAAEGVSLAVRSVPTVKLVRIEAMIDGNLERHSPSPIEQVMAAIEEFAKRSHTFKIDAAGLDKMKDILSIVNDLGGAGKSLTSLGEFQAPAEGTIGKFADTVAVYIKAIAGVAAQFKDKGLEHAAAISDDAQKMLGLLGNAVTGLASLNGFTGVSGKAMRVFVTTIRDYVDQLATATATLDVEGLEHAGHFADAAGKSVGIIANGIGGFEKMQTFRGVSGKAIRVFVETVRDFVDQLQKGTLTFEKEGLTLVGQFADAAQKSVGIIGDAVSGFEALEDYKGITRKSMEALLRDIELTVRIMGEVSAKFEREGVARTVEFAEAVAKVLAPIKTALDTFDGLKVYENIPAERLQSLAADMYEAYFYMGEIARGATTEGIEAATLFSETLVKVFTAMKGGIEALGGLRNYEGVPPERFQAFLNDMITSLGMMSQAAAQAEMVQGQADSWETALGGAASAIRAGIDTINALDGLTASATVNAAVNVNETSIGGDIEHLATGTRSFGGGIALVGERGPELVEMPGATRVHTTAQTKGILEDIAGSRGPQTINNTVVLNIERVDNEELVEVTVQRVAQLLAEKTRN